MPNITLIEPDGTEKTLAVKEGTVVMHAATDAGVKGIVAECGGNAMCATCHVYVDPAWAGKLPKPLANELEMLECTAAERQPNSRLSCQLKVTAALDGLILRIPERQQ
ncbi:MAG: 2Fe-2S iron-sulfur cluster-binding protein [Burkholderiales bacterium]